MRGQILEGAGRDTDREQRDRWGGARGWTERQIQGRAYSFFTCPRGGGVTGDHSQKGEVRLGKVRYGRVGEVYR